MTKIEEKFAENKVKMTEDQFWGLVASINWAETSLQPKQDYDAIHSSLSVILKKQGITDLRKIAGLAWNELDKLVGDARNPAGGGDDSHSDLLYHIVGLGKEEYYKHLNDYSLIEARGKARYQTVDGFRESFSYCLPY
jgi:hypothetical protein